MEALFERIRKFNSEMNQMEYIIPNDGEIISEITEDAYVKYYRCLSLREFKEWNGGICWDYVIYESYYFNNHFPEVRIKTFYIEINDSESHTVLVFFMNDKVYLFESSWKSMCGIYEFNNINDLLSFVLHKMLSLSNHSLSNTKYICIEYNSYDKKLFGMNCIQYMNHMHRYPEYKFQLNQHAKCNKFIQDKSIPEHSVY